ncbi:MAG: hypothetical protein CHH17_12620 [Candidatus Fluviicola riflensis]|nr:MAG: hypothetical protein CHH17_12620 [Candidatus Fluviicola riflensis]
MTRFQRIAGIGSTVLFSANLVFHVLILIGVIDYALVWGGRLKSEAQMLQFETVSLVLNFIFLVVICVRMNWIRINVPRIAVTVTLWLMAALFLLNTLGNLASLNSLETIIFTPVTLVLSVFCGVLALIKNQKTPFA